MNKKLIITQVLLIALLIGAVPAFAGVPGKAGQKVPVTRVTVIQVTNSMRSFGPVANTGFEFKRQGNTTREAIDYFNRMMKLYDWVLLEPNTRLTTKNNCFMILEVQQQKETIQAIMTENSEIKIEKNGPNMTLELVKGRLLPTSVESTNKLLMFVASVDHAKIEAWVDKLKKQYPKHDKYALASVVIKQKSDKAGFLNAVSGLAGPLSFPAGMAAELTKWIINAEIAYAIAYVYGYKPRTDEFMIDLAVLFGSDSTVKSAMKEAAGVTPAKITKSVIKQASAPKIKPVKDALVKKIASQLGKQITGSLVKSIPVAGSLIGGTSAFKDAKNFGLKAEAYYSGAEQKLLPKK